MSEGIEEYRSLRLDQSKTTDASTGCCGRHHLRRKVSKFWPMPGVEPSPAVTREKKGRVCSEETGRNKSQSDKKCKGVTCNSIAPEATRGHTPKAEGREVLGVLGNIRGLTAESESQVKTLYDARKTGRRELLTERTKVGSTR